jgi:hypothetical protein
MLEQHSTACAGTIREQVRQRQGSLWDTARAIHEHCGVGLLRAHRLAGDWTLVEVASKLRRQATEAGEPEPLVGHQRVSKWECGDEIPSPGYLDALCRLYRTRPDRLGFGHDYSDQGSETTVETIPAARASVQQTGSGPQYLAEVPRQYAHHSAVDEEEAIRRRELLRLAVVAGQTRLTAPILATIERIRQGMDDSLLVTEVGPPAVDWWEQVVDGHGFAHRSTPPLEMLTALVEDWIPLIAKFAREVLAAVPTAEQGHGSVRELRDVLAAWATRL